MRSTYVWGLQGDGRHCAVLLSGCSIDLCCNSRQDTRDEVKMWGERIMTGDGGFKSVLFISYICKK